MASKKIYQTIGRRLAAAFTLKNLTHSEIGKRLGYAAPTVSGWVQGRKKPPLAALMKISEISNVSLDYFLKGIVVANTNDSEAAAYVENLNEAQKYEQFLKTEEGVLHLEQSADADSRRGVMAALQQLDYDCDHFYTAGYAPSGNASQYEPRIIVFSKDEARDIHSLAKQISVGDRSVEAATIDLVRAAVRIALKNKVELVLASRALSG